jgi:hypothetical protein
MTALPTPRNGLIVYSLKRFREVESRWTPTAGFQRLMDKQHKSATLPPADLQAIRATFLARHNDF